MSALLRARVSSFLAGVGLTSLYFFYQLRADFAESHDVLAKQVKVTTSGIEERVARLEALVAATQKPAP